MAGIPREVQQWAVATTRSELVSFMSDLSVPESILQPYIVKKTEAVLPPVTETAQNSTEEPMELNSPATSTSSNESVSINLSDVEGDPLPAVVIGSEAWHSQVPAVSFSNTPILFVLKINSVVFRNGYQLSLGIHKDRDDKTHNSRLVMHIYLECLAKGGKSLQAPNPREVCLKL